MTMDHFLGMLTYSSDLEGLGQLGASHHIRNFSLFQFITICPVGQYSLLLLPLCFSILFHLLPLSSTILPSCSYIVRTRIVDLCAKASEIPSLGWEGETIVKTDRPSPSLR